MNSNLGIIIQARVGSSRLPKKMILPFFQNEKTILELIIIRMKSYFPSIPIIVATSNNQIDLPIIDVAKKYKVHYFSGNEENVLDRFIKAANKFSLNFIVRICGDNPFISPKYLKDIINSNMEDNDYTSFQINKNTPAIKSHLGLFGEIVQTKALLKVNTLTKEKIYREHVTNFIYSNPDIFRCNFLKLPEEVQAIIDVRLTVDTIEDFHITQEIYHDLYASSFEFDEALLFNYLKHRPDFLTRMKIQKNLNTKNEKNIYNWRGRTKP
jgi:spore coat polysaccharide biosynthesis protein SpsF